MNMQAVIRVKHKFISVSTDYTVYRHMKFMPVIVVHIAADCTSYIIIHGSYSIMTSSTQQNFLQCSSFLYCHTDPDAAVLQ